MLTSNEYFKCHQWCCHDVTDWQDFTAHVFNFFDLYATDVKIYPGMDQFRQFQNRYGHFKPETDDGDCHGDQSQTVTLVFCPWTMDSWSKLNAKKMDSFISTTSLAISWLENSWQIFLRKPWKMLRSFLLDWSSLVGIEILWLITNAVQSSILYSILLILIYSTLLITTASSMHFQGKNYNTRIAR